MIATVIHYCTNEYRFLKKIVEEARLFSQKIIIVTCDHFFNGQPENHQLLHQNYQEFADCTFLEFAYTPDRLYNPCSASYTPQDHEWSSLWHATSRYVAALTMPPEVEYALFLDADEIIDGKRFARWLATGVYRSFFAFRLGCYFYAHHASFRANKIFTSGLFTRMEGINMSSIINTRDRCGWFELLPEPKKKLLDEESIPFIHHYSWVRTKTECKRKAETWGHRLDKEWSPLIDQMFNDPNTADLLNLGIEFEEIDAVYFDPLAEPLNVLRVNEAMVQRKEVERLLV